MKRLARIAAVSLIGATASLGLVAPAEAVTYVKVYAQTVGRAYLTCVNIVGGTGLVQTYGPAGTDAFGRTYWWCRKA